MPAPPQYLYRQIYFHPREADVIAGGIRDLILRLTTEHADLDSSFIQRSYGWLGHQKDRFWEEARPRIRELAEFIDFLKTREAYYRNLTVSDWEQYENPAWAEYIETHG
jgi:hypothetical protein